MGPVVCITPPQQVRTIPWEVWSVPEIFSLVGFRGSLLIWAKLPFVSRSPLDPHSKHMPPCSELYQPKRKEVLIKESRCTKCLGGGWARLTSSFDSFSTSGVISPQMTAMIRLGLLVPDREMNSGMYGCPLAAGRKLFTTGGSGQPYPSEPRHRESINC